MSGHHPWPPPTSIASFTYTVLRHEYDDAEFSLVTLKCLGYPSKGVQPVEWEYVLRVPVADLPKWPLGRMMRLAVRPA